jgi:hypothetical protein
VPPRFEKFGAHFACQPLKHHDSNHFREVGLKFKGVTVRRIFTAYGFVSNNFLKDAPYVAGAAYLLGSGGDSTADPSRRKSATREMQKRRAGLLKRLYVPANELCAVKPRPGNPALGNSENLDLAPGSFDAGLSRVGLIYFPDQHKALSGMRRAQTLWRCNKTLGDAN